MAAWIAPAIEGGVSLISALFGKSSQNSANKTNLRIAQMNNEFNERMMNKQMAYNTEMWDKQVAHIDKQNEYNSAENQRKRLEDAGLNPYLMMNGGSAGTASSVPSAGGVTPAQAQAVQVNPYNYDFSGVGQAALAMAQLQMEREKTDASTRHLNMQSDWYAAKAAAEIGEIKSRTDSNHAKNYWQKVQNKYAEGLASSTYQNQILKNKETEQNIKNMVAQGNLMSKELAIFDERFKVSVANQVAQTQLLLQQGKLTRNQAAHEIYKQLETSAKIQGLKVSNSVLRRSAQSLVDKAYQDSMPNSMWGTITRGYRDIGNLTGLW